jgi:hypothetical protein
VGVSSAKKSGAVVGISCTQVVVAGHLHDQVARKSVRRLNDNDTHAIAGYAIEHRLEASALVYVVPALYRLVVKLVSDCIRLSVAFQAFVLALYPESGGIENMHAAPLVNRPASADEADSREFSDVIHSADFEFRNRIASDDGPQAYVRDPKNGERLQLAKEGWIIPAGRLYLALGFPDDFVWHDDSDPLPDPGIAYGPAETLIDGYCGLR